MIKQINFHKYTYRTLGVILLLLTRSFHLSYYSISLADSKLWSALCTILRRSHGVVITYRCSENPAKFPRKHPWSSFILLELLTEDQKFYQK